MINLRRISAMAAVFMFTVFTVFTYLSGPVFAITIKDETPQERLSRLTDSAWADDSPVSCGSSADGTNLPNGTPDENGQAIFTYFVSKGLKPFQAAGIIGNMVVESGLLPQRLQSTPASKVTTAAEAVGSSAGWGLVQFTPGSKFIKWSAPDYKDGNPSTQVDDPTAVEPYESANNLGTQLDFIWAQLEGDTHIPEGGAGDDLKGTATIEEAVLAFQGGPRQAVNGQSIGPYRGYERPANQTASVKLRVGYAISALTKYGSGATTGDPSVVTSIGNSPSTGGCSASAGDLDVMSYNILGSDKAPKWRERMGLALETIKAREPDMMGFQEVYDGQLTGIRDGLAYMYDVYPKPDNAGDGAKRPVYWNKNKFDLIKSGSYDIPKDGPVPQPWVLLKHKASGREFFFTNAHLMVGNSRSDANRRKDGAERMVAAIGRNNTTKAAVIMTGDYNSICGKDRDNETLSEVPCSIFAAAGLIDSYSTAEVKENDEYSTSHGGVDSLSKSGRRIDHVFYSKDLILGVAKWQNIVDEKTRFASDHTPIVATLKTGIEAAGVGKDGWAWPVKGNINPNNGNCFGVSVGGLGAHAGMDINSTKSGNIAYAAHNGTIAARGSGGASGNYVIIKTDGATPLYFGYQHLERVFVSKGDTVTAGTTQIGIIGHTGRVYGAPLGHLHVTLSKQQTLGAYGQIGNMLDPMTVLPEDAPQNYKCKGSSNL